jgi:hypothetical protein
MARRCATRQAGGPQPGASSLGPRPPPRWLLSGNARPRLAARPPSPIPRAAHQVQDRYALPVAVTVHTASGHVMVAVAVTLAITAPLSSCSTAVFTTS